MSENKRKWNSEKFLSISAMIMSFVTLIIFIYQTNLMRRQNYLAIMPYLSTATSNDSDDYSYSINLQNNGVGPAIIESVTFLYQGKRYDIKDYDNQFHAFLRSQDPLFDSLKVVSYGTLDKGLAIPANTAYLILGVEHSRRDYELLLSGLGQLLENGLEYEVVYKSIQDEYWVIRDDSEGPERW